MIYIVFGIILQKYQFGLALRSILFKTRYYLHIDVILIAICNRLYFESTRNIDLRYAMSYDSVNTPFTFNFVMPVTVRSILKSEVEVVGHYNDISSHHP